MCVCVVYSLLCSPRSSSTAISSPCRSRASFRLKKQSKACKNVSCGSCGIDWPLHSGQQQTPARGVIGSAHSLSGCVATVPVQNYGDGEQVTNIQPAIYGAFLISLLLCFLFYFRNIKKRKRKKFIVGFFAILLNMYRNISQRKFRLENVKVKFYLKQCPFTVYSVDLQAILSMKKIN